MLELAQKVLETALLAAQQPFPDCGASGARRWEPRPSPASFLAEPRRCCLGERHEGKQAKRGFGLGGCLTSLLAQPFCSPCIQILAWLLPPSVIES